MKKKIPKINTISEQYIDFFENTEVHELNYSETVYKLLTDLNENDLINVVYYLELKNPQHYENLSNELDRILIENPDNKIKLLGFKTKHELEFLNLIREEEIFDSEEKLLAILIGVYIKLINPNHPFLKTIYDTVIPIIVDRILKCLEFIRSKIEDKTTISFDTALTFFFLYEKEKALTLFKNFIQRDLETSYTDSNQLRHWRQVEIFFRKLQIDYIPYLKINTRNPSISMEHKIDSIKFKEIMELVDNEDYFNNKIPLSNFPPEALLIPENNFTDKQDVIEILSDFIIKELKCEIVQTAENRSFNIIEVFFDNISNPLPKFTKYELIRTREVLTEALLKKNKRKHFLALLFCMRDKDVLKSITGKINEIISSYFGSNIYKVSTVKNYVSVKSAEFLPKNQFELVNKMSDKYF